jgi:CubicO group peptidase (beta-lactamase class C family)
MTRTRRTSLALTILLAVIWLAVPAIAEPLTGHWRGAIELPGTKLEIDVDLVEAEDGALSGDISIPAQAAKDLPLADLAREGDGVRFAIAGIPGAPSFDGRLEEGGAVLRGTFTQGGAAFPFELRRGATGAERARERLAGLDETLAKAVADFEVAGLALAVVAGGEVVYERGFGLRDRERELPVTPDTLFAVGSTTKAMTATLLGTLVDEGKLGWDDPVRRHLPWFALADPIVAERLTVRDALSHRSGLPRHDLLWYNHNEGTRREMIERLAHLDLTADLRARWQYNNLLFLTAGYLAGELAGATSWEEAMRARLFAPLGMARSNFSVEESQGDPDHALPYKREEDGDLTRIPFRPLDLVGPAGSVNSSAREMARWALFNLARGEAGELRIVQAQTLAEIHKVQMPTGATALRPDLQPVGYALGWMVDVYRGHRRVHHGGGIDGFVAMVTLFPDDDLAVVSFTNTISGLPELVNRTVSDRVLGLEPVDWLAEGLAELAAGRQAQAEAKTKKDTVRVAGTRPSHPLGDYAGDYLHAGYGRLRIELVPALKGKETRRLTLHYNGIAAPLEHWHYDVWNGASTEGDPTFENIKVLFRTDVAGAIAALEATLDVIAPPVVFAKAPPARLSDPEVLARYVGRYQLASQIAEVTLAGGTLRVALPGQPVYTLEPLVTGRFRLRELTIIEVGFVEREGRVTGLAFHQPNGVFEAEKLVSVD